MGLIPGSGRSPGEGNGNPLKYSRQENSMDRGAWQGYSSWGHNKSDMTEDTCTPSPLALNLSQHQSFPMSWLFKSGGQGIGASASVLPMNI